MQSISLPITYGDNWDPLDSFYNGGITDQSDDAAQLYLALSGAGELADFGIGLGKSLLKKCPASHPLFKPGPHAGRLIPARSTSQKFTPEERNAINEIGYDTGCHSCGATDPGTVSGNFIPDHQPISALNVDNAPQQLYPQCINCSRDQGLSTARTLKAAQQ